MPIFRLAISKYGFEVGSPYDHKKWSFEVFVLIHSFSGERATQI